jgi:hypothetical protein
VNNDNAAAGLQSSPEDSPSENPSLDPTPLEKPQGARRLLKKVREAHAAQPLPAEERPAEEKPAEEKTGARRAKTREAALPGEYQPPAVDYEGRSAASETWELLRTLWRSKYRLRIGLLAAGIVAILVGNMFGQVQLNTWHGAFFDALEQQNLGAFGNQLLIFLAIVGVLLALVARPDLVPVDDGIVSWFYRTLRNAAIDRFRRRATAERAAVAFAREMATEVAPPEDLRAEICACVSRLAATLKPEYAEALAAIDVAGLPVKAYAERQGLTAANAAVRVFRARRALKQRLSESCGTCADHGCRDCTCRA